MPKPHIVFRAYVARVTESDVISDRVGSYATLDEAEAAIQPLVGEWHGATIYELLIHYDEDRLGPIPIEGERSCRNYVVNADGAFELDELIEVSH